MDNTPQGYDVSQKIFYHIEGIIRKYFSIEMKVNER